MTMTANPHLIDGEFQSDKYPSTPRGKVPLSTKDKTAQDLLWQYAQRRRPVDAEFADALEAALELQGYKPSKDARRERLKERLQELDKAQAEIDKARAPFDAAMNAVQGVREVLLEEHEAEIAGTCDVCGTPLFVGELGHRREDGPDLCLEHAPTWNDMRRQYDEAKAGGFFEKRSDSPEAARQADEAVDARIAAGDGDKKHVWPL